MMLHRRTAALGLAALLGLSAAGLGSAPAQAEHCRPMLMFSGHAAADQAGPKTNPGVGGCLFVNHEDENVNTNYFVPGANALSVGVTADPAGWSDTDQEGDRDEVVTDGTVTVTYDDPVAGRTTVVEPLTWTWNGTTRWNSQNLSFPGPLVEATGEVLTQPGITISVTYRAATEDLS